ncbi:MAG: methionyl-tRNA formyltransferase [Pseudomonadota bacterium]
MDAATRACYRHNLVVHASDLPKGKGWSPASWQILAGAGRIPVTLFEAVDAVDAGPIYLQEWLDLDGTELLDEWRGMLAKATINLVRSFVAQYPDVLKFAREQLGEPSFYPRRRDKDSELTPTKTLAEQFNHLRIVDNERYPAFFRYKGREYVIKVYTP